MWHRGTMTGLPLGDRFSKTAKKVTKFTHWWTIENFSFHPRNKTIESSLFSAGLNDGVEWKLFLCPDGASEANRGFISLHLKMFSCIISEAPATHKISIFNADHESKATMQSEEPGIFISKVFGWGWGCVIERDQVLSSINFPGDTLIVRSEISYAADEVPAVPNLNSPFAPEVESSADFRELLKSGLFSDVVFNVRGKEFRAHKAILASRSPTFETLFDRNSGNTQPTRVEIRDADDHTLSELLDLIYSGNESFQRIQNLLSEIAAQGQATCKTDVLDVKKEEETTPGDDSTASTVSILESIDKIPVITSSISAASLHSKKDESSKSEVPTEEPIETEEVTHKPSSDNIEVVLPSERDEDVQDNQLRSSSIGTAEQIQVLTPVVGVRAFYGDRSQFFEWWREFKVQVHDRQDLSQPQKVVELLSALGGETRECFDTTVCVWCMYFGTLDGLFIRYGNIEALPPGMFALLIVRQQNFSTRPLRIVDNRMLMERIEKTHRVPVALESAESREIECKGKQEALGSDLIPEKDPETGNFSSYSGSGCQCQALNSGENHDDASMHWNKSSNCVLAVEQQLGKLESIFAETQKPDPSTLESLAKETSLTAAAIQMWFKLRPIDWRHALQPNRQLEVYGFNGGSTETEAIDSDGSGYDVIDSQSLSSSAKSSTSSSSESDFQLV